MSLKFRKIITTPCAVDPNPDPDAPPVCPKPPSTDNRCEDPVYRAAHPDECQGFARLIVKPGSIVLCNLQSVVFKAYLVANGQAEQEITNGLLWATSDRGVISISGLYGTATGVAAGIATVSVAWQGLSGSAQVTVLPECCADRKVGIAILIDNSDSMNQNFGGQHGGSKLEYAKKLAHDYVTGLNLAKDAASVNVFNLSGAVTETFTTDLIDLQVGILGLSMTHQPTDIADGLEAAIAELDAQTDLDMKVVVLFSDGYQTVVGDPIEVADMFRSRGGFILGVGIRAFGESFDLMQRVANTGYFINAHLLSEPNIPNWLGGLSGYFCAGNCVPPGDIVILGHGKLNYNEFENWDVWGVNGESSVVDLIGGDNAHPEYDVFNLIPGNGLMVDLRGSPGLGGLRSKETFQLTAGNRYHITLRLAGNQRKPDQFDYVFASMGEQWEELIGPIDPFDPFNDYEFSFIATHSVEVKFLIQQQANNDPFHWRDTGNLVDRIKIEEEWLTTDESFDTLIDDNFDTENGGYIPPECDQLVVMPDRYSPTLEAFGYGYSCYGYGCLFEPIPAQVPDPAPLPSINEGGEPQGGGGGGVEGPASFDPAGIFITIAGLMEILRDYVKRHELDAYATKLYVDERIGSGGGTDPNLLHFAEDVNGNWVPDVDLEHSVGTKLLPIKGLYTDHTVIHPTDDFPTPHLWLEHPTVAGQFYRVFAVQVEDRVVLDVDQTPIELPMTTTVDDSGIEHWAEVDDNWAPDIANEHNVGAPDRTIKSVFFSKVAILDGEFYLRHPTLATRWYKFLLADVEGIMVPDVDQDYVTIAPGSGTTADTIEHWIEDTPGNWVPDLTSMFTLGREDRRLISLYTGGPVVWQGDLYLKVGSSYHKVLLADVEGVVVPDVQQSSTTIT